MGNEKLKRDQLWVTEDAVRNNLVSFLTTRLNRGRTPDSNNEGTSELAKHVSQNLNLKGGYMAENPGQESMN